MLPLAEYRFTYQAIDDVTLPPFAGSLWHGVFGRALKSQVCIAPDSRCEQCMLLHNCDYAYLFHGPRPPDSVLMRSYNTIPVPHIMRIKNREEEKIITAGKEFSVSMVLVGKSNKRIAAVIRAMLEVGMAGFGKKRAKARLVEVSQTGVEALTKLIMSQGKMHHNPQPAMAHLPPMPNQLRMIFVTPYKQSANKEKNHNFDLKKMVMAIVRRVSLLKYFYTGEMLEEDFKQLKEKAEMVTPIAVKMNWCKQKRYSARAQKSLDTSGWLGSMDLPLTDIEQFWPYLYLGQWLHLGKNSSMGFGRYELVVIKERHIAGQL